MIGYAGLHLAVPTKTNQRSETLVSSLRTIFLTGVTICLFTHDSGISSFISVSGKVREVVGSNEVAPDEAMAIPAAIPFTFPCLGSEPRKVYLPASSVCGGPLGA